MTQECLHIIMKILFFGRSATGVFLIWSGPLWRVPRFVCDKWKPPCTFASDTFSPNHTVDRNNKDWRSRTLLRLSNVDRRGTNPQVARLAAVGVSSFRMRNVWRHLYNSQWNRRLFTRANANTIRELITTITIMDRKSRGEPSGKLYNLID